MTFTKEQLIAQARENVKALKMAVVQNAFKDIRPAIELDLALAELALAGMEAEPVAWLWSNRKHSSEVTLIRPEDDERAEAAQWSGWSCQALYSAPQSDMVVPDEMPDSVYEILCQACGGGEKACDFADELWNACRAAMLQAKAEPVSNRDELATMTNQSEQVLDMVNSPVIQDGWVACSERMPSAGDYVLAYRPDAPESNDPLIKMAKYISRSAHGHGFDCYCKPTHWMPLPAAPQQEVKP
ncbi:MAG: DUF551 domain-containing protein [Enterobacter sp.]|jgi:hypothetical protein|nr:DUF551 domain-containing protein [Enterobacter sp.]